MGVLLAHSLVAQTPPELESVRFSGPELTPCPACLCAAPTGEIFVGVDMRGSLGKGPGKGKIVRLVDADGDGKPEKSTKGRPNHAGQGRAKQQQPEAAGAERRNSLKKT